MKEVHQKSEHFQALFEPTTFKRVLNDLQYSTTTEAGIGYLRK